jgi:hypothetical protein
MANTDGIMTVEALSTQGGLRPPLEVETAAGDIGPCCWLDNPRSIQVKAGTEVIANVEMVLGSTTSQSFVVNVSIARP